MAQTFIGALSQIGDLDMNFFRITNLDFPAGPFDATNRDYVDTVLGPGLLNSNNTWTGTNTWTNTASFNSSTIFIGDSQSDRVFNVADQDFHLTPRSNNDIDLGNVGSRWRDAYLDNIFMTQASGVFITQGISQFNNFTNFTDDVLIDSGGDLQIQGGGDLFVQSPGSGVFSGALLPQGLFFHSGSQIGFFGAGLDTRNTVFDVNATGNPGIDSLLAIGAINQLMFALEDYGLINVI